MVKILKIWSGNKKNENLHRSETKTSKHNVQPTSRIRDGKSNRKSKNVIILHTYKEHKSEVNFVPRRSYDRAEDWMVTCSVCHGSGATGEGDLRKRCPNCDGSGKVRSNPQTRKIIRNSSWYARPPQIFSYKRKKRQ